MMSMITRPASLRLLAFCLIAITLFGCSKRRFRMPSGSMIPTLPVGAELSADKGVKAPARGEVWLFRFPEHPEQEFVKRIVGFSGDRIEMRGDVLVINGTPVPSCEVGPYDNVADGVTHSGRLVLEKTDAATYLTFLEGPAHAFQGPWEVKAGEHFAIGDNRHNSHDSRSWRGGVGAGVPQDLLIGRVEVPLLSLPAGAEGLGAGFSKCMAELGVSR